MLSGMLDQLYEQGQALSDRRAEMFVNRQVMAYLQELQQHIQNIVAALSQQLLRHGAQAAAHLPDIARAPSSSLEQSYMSTLRQSQSPPQCFCAMISRSHPSLQQAADCGLPLENYWHPWHSRSVT